MAGVSIPGLKRRLKTVTSTKKITTAMSLVSTSKYQKARVRLTANDEHYKAFADVIGEILSVARTSEEKNQLLESPHPDRPILLILFNSERGLVGGYNSAIMETAAEVISGQKRRPYVITVGSRGVNPVRKLVKADHMEQITLSDLPAFGDTDQLLERALELYRTGRVSEVRIIYTHYISALRDEVRVQTVLPIHAASAAQADTSTPIAYEFEPEPAAMQEELLVLFVREQLYNLLLHARTVEHSTRMKAMDSANKNAEEILNDLSKQLNRIRQTAITQEITEIVGGAEALK